MRAAARTMTRCVVLLGLALPGLVPGAAAAKALPKPTDPTHPISAVVGRPFAVIVTSDASTGFSWRVTALSGGLRVVRSGYVQGRALPGAPGRQLFVLRAVRAGRSSVALVYQRPFGKHEVAERVRFIVMARARG